MNPFKTSMNFDERTCVHRHQCQWKRTVHGQSADEPCQRASHTGTSRTGTSYSITNLGTGPSAPISSNSKTGTCRLKSTTYFRDPLLDGLHCTLVNLGVGGTSVFQVTPQIVTITSSYKLIINDIGPSLHRRKLLDEGYAVVRNDKKD